MVSYLGIPYIRIVFIIALSLVFKAVISSRLRDRLTPWCFAGLMVHGNLVPFIGGFAHFLLLMLYFLEMAFLLDGFNLNYFKRNLVFSVFMVFWGYLTFTSLYSEEFFFCITTWLANLIELVLVGYFVGIWVLKTPNGIVRLIKPLTLVAGISCLFYFRYGFALELDHTGRGRFSEELAEMELGNNINDMGLVLSSLVAALVVFLTAEFVSRYRDKFWSAISIASLVLCSYLLIRTGSRNSTLVLVPCVYFIYKVLSANRKITRLLWVAFLVGLPLFLSVNIFMGSTDEVRAFKLMTSGERFSIDAATSGRWGEFVNFLRDMDAVDYFIGKGPEVLKTQNGLGMGGCLSVYVTLLRFTGVVGLTLLSVYFLSVLLFARKNGVRGQIALLFFMVWAVTNLAEGQGIRRGHAVRLLQGVSLGLCSQLRFRSREEMWHMTSPPPQMGYRA